MCGGRGTRLDADVEKPLYPIAGEPMVDRVRRALAGSDVETTYAVVSPNAPRTREHLAEAGVPPIETPGEGYVADLGRAIADSRVERPVLTVAADLAALETTAVNDVLDAYERYRQEADGNPSTTICVPVALKERLGLSVDGRLRPDEDSGIDGPVHVAADATADGPLAPTGCNVVGASDIEVIHVSDDPCLAINVNRVEDARIAEARCA